MAVSPSQGSGHIIAVNFPPSQPHSLEKLGSGGGDAMSSDPSTFLSLRPRGYDPRTREAFPDRDRPQRSQAQGLPQRAKLR